MGERAAAEKAHLPIKGHLSLVRPQRPRGSANELHHAAADVSAGRLVVLLSAGRLASIKGARRAGVPSWKLPSLATRFVVRDLLNKGADVSIAGDSVATARHLV